MRIKRSAGVLLALLLVSTASRAFMLGGTRVVVYQDEGNSLLKVIGSSSDPLSLIRSRVTRSVDDNHQVANFFVTPPLFRLEPGGRSMLRISLLSPKGLPVDRESLFYLKVAGIPATNPLARNSRQGFAGASLLLGTGNIIKVFYRPHGIGAPTVDSWRQLRWQRVPGGLRITNPTPWTVTFFSVSVDGYPVEFDATHPIMLAPFSSQMYGSTSVQKKQAAWVVLNDAGGKVSGTAAIN
ncbi:hypothetical protein BL250_17465 [Erwinia sp. OLTSP20]|uniref:fimbrial biogenesis chaperone n=1 Tax=unclassified Erwinia TaxID=2622719 RepID=UPI000C371ECA|nr:MULTISPECIES: molecular chaperone [unclassified Erwinia]PIJ48206.1 hypothetical protein BV501_17990 [Erwinia sp. OAMSP11]PIJ66747.1 hypothetical protein BK416_17465 [Erwinia sp. OLSSP12]PIJ78194.1 hypothetical protein BLD47_17345 [Erwinia sp. OLCASP19]PIJ79015.1 hypothetical protein BLD46_17535 [Erwinia sp. OLMTSP26]PIJ80027.1 hypothetical protein BLD49_17260 [Erwinia sp. OLMDSP33]